MQAQYIMLPLPGSEATIGWLIVAMAIIAVTRVVLRLMKLLPFF